MLHIDIIQRDKIYRLAIKFSHIVSEKISRHSEFTKFWDLICTQEKFHSYKHNSELAGFDIPLNVWGTLVSKIFPEHTKFQQKFINEIYSRPKLNFNKYIEVDHHQYSFDNAERWWKFILNQGYFFQYVLNRIYWQLAPKLDITPSFPLHVDIETANTCNMNCPMCYRHMIKEVGQMDLNLFKSVIDQCKQESVFSVRLSWRGEPLTHPHIKDMIEYATQRIPNVSFLTNAFYLEDDIINCIIKNKLSYVAVSFDGVEEIYEKIRHPALFSNSRKRLENLQKQKKIAGALLPQVRLCTIWPAIRNDPDRYKELMQPVSDYMVYNPYINFKGKMTLKDDFVCQYPWQRIMVAWNGKTQCCTGWNATDILLGNAADKSIRELWHCDRMREIRNKHREGRRMELTSCAECRHGSKGDPDVSIDAILERKY